MRLQIGVALLIALVACEKQLSPTEKAAKDRSECSVLAIDQRAFDPVTAEEPPRTVSSSQQRGGSLKEGAVDVGKGAVGGAVVGVVGGAIMGEAGKGAAAGAAVGGLIGGARHYQQRKEVVTTTRPNPEYQRHVDFAAKQLTSEDGQRTSPIGALETLDAVLVLQGHQNGRGWTMVVERATGHLSATITDAEGVFVLAGACSAP